MLRKLLLVTVAVAPASAGLARPWLGMAPSLGLGLGRTALRCSARILWRRLRRSTACPRSVGSALDLSESVLVTEKIGGDFRAGRLLRIERQPHVVSRPEQLAQRYFAT
jgi:hypothetical protein